MKYSFIPGTSVQVSAIGLGSWVLGGENWGGSQEAESLMAIGKTLDLGMNFIDTAPFYGNGVSEQLIGKAIKGRRDKVFIATKCGLIRNGGRVVINLSSDSIQKEVDESRKRLGVDTIDLYQCHWPDDNTPVEKTMEALCGLQKSGAITHIGVSNFGLLLLKKALEVAKIKTLQVQYSLIERAIEPELLPFCVENNIGVIAYGPMGGGILTGKYQKKPQFGKWDARSMFYKCFEEKKFKDVTELLNKLKSFNRPLNQLALNWVRQQKGVMTTLCGCRNVNQVVSNAASADWDLTGDELTNLRELVIKV